MYSFKLTFEAILGFLLFIANIGIVVFYIVKVVKYATALSNAKILKPETAEKLVNSGKLKIDGADEIINKYKGGE